MDDLAGPLDRDYGRAEQADRADINRPRPTQTQTAGRAVSDFSDIARYVQIRAGERVTIAATRGGTPFTTHCPA
jgi:hypothetical protein